MNESWNVFIMILHPIPFDKLALYPLNTTQVIIFHKGITKEVCWNRAIGVAVIGLFFTGFSLLLYTIFSSLV